MQQEVALTIYVDCWLKLSLNSDLHLRRLKCQEIQILWEIGVSGEYLLCMTCTPTSQLYSLHCGIDTYITGWSRCILETLCDCSLCRPSMTMKGASMEMWPLISKRWWDSRGTEAMRQQFTTKGHQMDTFAMKGTKDVIKIWKWGLIGKKTLGLVAKCPVWVATKNGKRYLDRIPRMSIV